MIRNAEALGGKNVSYDAVKKVSFRMNLLKKGQRSIPKDVIRYSTNYASLDKRM